MIDPQTKIPGSYQLFKDTTLIDNLNQDHFLVILAKNIDWDYLEESLYKFFNESIGRKTKSLRAMIAIIILQYMLNLSDEDIVAQCMENVYYQAFIGNPLFVNKRPCSPSTLSRFRKKIGQEGCELILQESVRIHGKKAFEKDCIADTTVQEKNITFPTALKLIIKAIMLIYKIAAFMRIPFAKKYVKDVKNIQKKLNFGRNNLTEKQKEEEMEYLKEIANYLLKTLMDKMPKRCLNMYPIKTLFSNLKKLINQKKYDKNKIYSIHEPQTKCIAKGKSDKKYEYGNKVSIVATKSRGVIVGCMGFKNNEYDGNTLSPAIKQIDSLLKYKPQSITADRGYKGRQEVNDVKIITPYDNKDGLLPNLSRKIKKLLQRRTSIESIISHLKNDHKMGRNYLKGVLGDTINPILAAAAFNFLKYARLEFAKIQLQRKYRHSTKHMTQTRRKFTDLPLWREDNSLFK